MVLSTSRTKKWRCPLQNWLVAVLLATLAIRTSSGGEDDLLPDPIEEVTWETWEGMYAAIRDDPVPTTLEKTRLLREAAQNKRIRWRGKIEDIVPTGPDGVVIYVCGVFGGEPRRIFTVEKEGVRAVAAWQRWDRVSWLTVIDIRTADHVIYQDLYGGPADLHRTPNPGIEEPPLAKPRGVAAGLSKLLLTYARSVVRRQWSAARDRLEEAAEKAWIVPGTVSEVDGANRRVRVKIDNDRLHVVYRDRMWGLVDSAPWADVIDPQAMTVLEKGSKVELAVDIDTVPEVGVLSSTDGWIPLAVRVWRRVP